MGDFAMSRRSWLVLLFYAVTAVTFAVAIPAHNNCTTTQNNKKISTAHKAVDCGEKMCSNLQGDAAQVSCICKHCDKEEKRAAHAACLCGNNNADAHEACKIFSHLAQQCSGVGVVRTEGWNFAYSHW